MDAPSQTSPTLLGRLRFAPGDQTAWNAFVLRYGRKIYGWGLCWGLQEADAEDVTQNVLLRLTHALRDFRYDPQVGSFRAWLRTLTRRTWQDFLKTRQHVEAGTGDSRAQDRLESIEAGDDLVRRLEEEFDLELVEEANARVRLRVAEHTWRAYQLLTADGLPAAEVARHLEVQIGVVYVAKNKVLTMLREEIEKLEVGG
jgi:RNA polymerase sigma-70 factor (ECF subfamily)